MDYSQPGWYQWGDPGMAHSWFSWVVPIEPGLEGRRVLRPPLRERTREAALAAVRRLDPRLREAALYSVREWFSMHQPPSEGEGRIPLEAQVFPTELGLTFVYIPGLSNARPIRILHGDINNWQPSW